MAPRARRRLAALFAIPLIFYSLAAAKNYEVGPGKALSRLADVPWERLEAGDEVRIHWRAEPYREKWVLNAIGTPERWVHVIGVAGPAGQRPVIEGRDARDISQRGFNNEDRGLLKIGRARFTARVPAYVAVSGLEFRNAHPLHSFRSSSGATTPYADNAAAIYIDAGHHILIRDCALLSSANGLFVGGDDAAPPADIAIERSRLAGNGIEGSAYVHDSYTTARGMRFTANSFEPLRPGAPGHALKDRSSGLVIEFNRIEGGSRCIDLPDAASPLIRNSPGYHDPRIEDNLLIKPSEAENGEVLLFGGDSSKPLQYRRGPLRFRHNTVIVKPRGRATLIHFVLPEATADVSANAVQSAARFTPSSSQSPGIGKDNCFSGSDPGFTDPSKEDYRLRPTTACRSAQEDWGVRWDLYDRARRAPAAIP